MNPSNKQAEPLLSALRCFSMATSCAVCNNEACRDVCCRAHPPSSQLNAQTLVVLMHIAKEIGHGDWHV